MTDVPSIKAEKDKAAIDAMKSASSHMQTALSRIERLEYAINKFSGLVDDILKHIPDESYRYNSTERTKESFTKSKVNILDYLK